MRACLHGGPKDGEVLEQHSGCVKICMIGSVPDEPGVVREGTYLIRGQWGPAGTRCFVWAGWGDRNWLEPIVPDVGDWRTFYGPVTISNQLAAELEGINRAGIEARVYNWRQEYDGVNYGTPSAEWSPDEAGGMLLEELLDQSTLDWLEKVKAKRA